MSRTKREYLIISWLVWHYRQMPLFLFSAWKNYLDFGLNYFSTPLLMGTLFNPWRKYRWNYPKSFNILELFNTAVSNTFSRITGAICRLIFIIFGLLAEMLIFITGIIVILLWVLMPIISIFIIVIAFTL